MTSHADWTDLVDGPVIFLGLLLAVCGAVSLVLWWLGVG